MARMDGKKAKQKGAKEPVFLVKSASKHGGLDYLHIGLIALVIVLIALSFSLANFKSVIVCQYGVSKSITNNSVIAQGVVSVSGKTTCVSNTPEPVYLITDPYAPGAISSILQAINISKAHSNEINMSYKFVFSGYSISKYKNYGEEQTQLLGAYLACGSTQKEFPQFMNTLNTVYNGSPLPNDTLYSMAQASGFNMSSFGNCMANAPATLLRQEQLASFYNVTFTPVFIANCKYEAIPATALDAINYSIEQLK